MSLFRRALTWLFLILGLVAGIVVSAAAFFARRLVKPSRPPLWANPGDLGLAYEEVQFAARDDVRLSGWFVPAPADSKRKNAAIVLVHGWPWNRLGDAAEDLLSRLLGTTLVDLLRLAFSLHQDGFHVLMFDLRNHGESASAPPVTLGWKESQDLLGALTYLEERSDVDEERIGVIGFSMGANTVLYALPQTKRVQAAIAVQPVTVRSFAGRLGADLVGPLGPLVVFLTELMYRTAGGPPFSALKPGFAAAGSGKTPILYIQSKGDRWGSVNDVTQMAANSPLARGPLLVDAQDRFAGYRYLIDNPKIATAFFEQHLPE